MEALLVLIVVTLGLALLDAVAIRFGVDSRDGSHDRRKLARPIDLR